jgi:hypothetical protein
MVVNMLLLADIRSSYHRSWTQIQLLSPLTLVTIIADVILGALLQRACVGINNWLLVHSRILP